MTNQFEFKTSGRLICLGNAINRYRNMQSALWDLTSTQSGAICYILKNSDRDLTARNIMDHLQLSPSTVAGIISRLCEKGLIARKQHETDFRKIIITVTEKGESLNEQLRKIGAETEDLLLSGMSEKEKEGFNRLIQAALANMNTQRYPKQEK